MLGSNLEECGQFWKNKFFLEEMAGLEKYRIGGYGQKGVYRINTKLAGPHVVITNERSCDPVCSRYIGPALGLVICSILRLLIKDRKL